MGTARSSLPSALRPSDGGETAAPDPLLAAALALATVLLCGCGFGAAGCLACRRCRRPRPSRRRLPARRATKTAPWRQTSSRVAGRAAPATLAADDGGDVCAVLRRDSSADDARPVGGAVESECWRL